MTQPTGSAASDENAERPSASTPSPPASDAIVVEVRADLDLPGETGRQSKIFAVWVSCLFLAVVLSSIAASRAGDSSNDRIRTDAELAQKRVARARVGIPVGFFLPAVWSYLIHLRHRRGGGHARGIFIDVTHGGELRIWGRGYGSRVAIDEVDERFVDVYTGRLGAWRQLRLRVRAKSSARGTVNELEIATQALKSDLERDLRAEGGEGDCIELTREDYFRIRDAVFAHLNSKKA
ncbi:MAG: hypothetical protein IPK82_01005 [Polyangiaceae bacterium]|nr:hypothetical protein [Polyangiaceae bacterium]